MAEDHTYQTQLSRPAQGKMIYRPVILFMVILLFSGLAQQAWAQVTIQGTVNNELTGEPIHGANVYIEGTTTGDNTGEDGQYSFTTDQSGEQVLIVSFIGYHTVQKPVLIGEEAETLSFDFELRIEEYALEDIVITADNREWQRNFEDFRRAFLGTTSFALNCEIVNKWAIDFLRKPNGELSASAREPVLVANRALGYWVEVELHDFNWELQNESGYFLFNEIRFEEMEPQTDEQLRRWEANRERAYQGSFRHFLISLYIDELSRNRFSVVSHEGSSRMRINPMERSMQVIQILMAYRIPATELDETVKVYHLREPVDILYGIRGMGSERRPRATITPNSSNNTFVVHKNGYLIDGRSLTLSGTWKNTRISNMLPPDYLP